MTATNNVPKFASFRPKPKPAPVPTEESKKNVTPVDVGKEKASRVRAPSPRPAQSPSHRHTSSSQLFFSDRRGDANLLRYGTFDRSGIPVYHRFGQGHVLGLPLDQKIDRHESTSTAISTTPARKRQQRLLTDKRLNKSTHRALRLVNNNLNNNHLVPALNQDFIPITSYNLPGGHGHDQEDDIPRLDYCDMQGHLDVHVPPDPDTFYEPDVDVVVDTEVTKKHSLLARRTKEHPEDIQNWLDLIEHQEAMFSFDRPSEELTASDKAHLAQIRISIYEEALKKTKTDQRSQPRLWRGLLTEARVAWDHAKMASKWKEVLAQHPYSIDLWWLYLDFTQSSFTKFKFEDCRLAFLSCVDALRSSAETISVEIYLHILVRLTSMIYDCGYQELALAIWQANLEYHLMNPDEYQQVGPLSMFEEFWESEAPRIGESKAKGWSSSNALDCQPYESTPLLEAKPSTTPLQDFQRREMDAMRKLQYPGRTCDDVCEDDPFHTVLFSDLEAYLHIIPPGTSAILIVEAFLCFCGLPPLTLLAAHQKEWWSDPLLPHQAARVSDNDCEAAQALHTFEKSPKLSYNSFRMTTKSLFEHSFNLRNERLDPDLLRQVLKLVATRFPDQDSIGQYLLAFESRHFPADACRTAKQLLKTRPSNLRLYNAYSFVESSRGNFDKANQVRSMALSLQKDEMAFATLESLQLYHDWVWQALDRKDPLQALWRLVCPNGKGLEQASTASSPSHESILHTRLLLGERSETGLLHGELEIAVLSTSLLALLIYLVNDSEAGSALEIHQGLIAWMKSHNMSQSIYAELHAQSIADFLAYHATHAAIIKPALIRNALEPLIALFPNNIILLSLYAKNEARFAIDDRVRTILHSSTLRSGELASVDGWIFAIHYEMLRGEVSGSTENTARALYKRATTSSAQYSLDLWIAYLEFEHKQLLKEEARMTKRSKKDGGRDYCADRVRTAMHRIKEAFHNGLSRLPWCKDFIMLAFSPDFERVFEDEEKWKFYKSMHEKEIRLYVDLDEAGQ
ncbi:hypothetical protein IAQ61_004997 [Plenodomus lingam]|uniref:DUF1740-domain-containing protein n=1 Tax=Leptosphaeria maculans (strain JN3 / isolate v23.1.3 / race Av1-4-5-6-7-8) TaxID=985895 RepID=M1ZIU0_LEPMJ|nr:hypothetical protein IAQ61_004997 [Plenodomus lingam]CCT61182.1 hypothetical protein [Plenodomus lingam JN3]